MPDDPKYQATDPRADDLPAGVIVSADTHRANRLPPGQSQTRRWPVLHYGRVPEVLPERWRLEIGGLVERPLALAWKDYQALPRVEVFADFHCVTQWSRLGNLWQGVAIEEISRRVGIKPAAKYVVVTGYDDGWTTNLPLADLLGEDVLLADRHDGEPLTADHGGPVRLVVPRLYAWKSAKWVRRLEFCADDHPGLWEQMGYHNRGNPWSEERYQR